MKVIGISASPRRTGNSEILLDKVLEGAVSRGASVEKIILNELNIKPCQECGGCDKSGLCVIRDDMGRLYNILDSADAVIISSPVFFASVSAQAKTMIDRMQCAWIAKYVFKKAPRLRICKGIFISVAGSERVDSFTDAKNIIRAFFATIDIEYSDELLCSGMETAACVRKDGKLLSRAYVLGESIVNKKHS